LPEKKIHAKVGGRVYLGKKKEGDVIPKKGKRIKKLFYIWLGGRYSSPSGTARPDDREGKGEGKTIGGVMGGGEVRAQNGPIRMFGVAPKTR